MKRNLLSIIILFLLIVNVAINVIIMTSVVDASKKTTTLVNDIASALKLELYSGTGGGSTTYDVPMEDVEVYKIANQMTIPLKAGDDGEVHYCLLSVALSMNTKNPGYKTYGATLAEKESLITGEIYEAVGNYTLEEAQANKDIMREDILKRIQRLFSSDFIYKVAFSDVIFQ